MVGGVIFERLNDYESDNDFSEVGELYDSAQKLRARLEAAVSHIKEKADADFQEYHSERLVNMATDTLLAYLLCIDALKSDRKKKIAQLFIAGAQIRVKSTQEFILADDVSMMEFHADIIKQEEVL